VPDLYAPTLDEQIAEVEREIEMRHRVYGQRRAFKTTDRLRDERRIEIMRAVYATLVSLREGGGDAPRRG
jgi:putative ubiquitin-RnfH superfamily antitoxin RatB of RatAB toxin-antitoxin module